MGTSLVSQPLLDAHAHAGEAGLVVEVRGPGVLGRDISRTQNQLPASRTFFPTSLTPMEADRSHLLRAFHLPPPPLLPSWKGVFSEFQRELNCLAALVMGGSPA